MDVQARLEKQERWEMWEDGTPKSVRMLCGERGPDGAQCCPGCLGTFYFPTERRRAYFLLQPTVEALSERGIKHLTRHRRQNLQRREQLYYIDLPTAEIPRGECPRCHTDQALLDDDDLTALAQYLKIGATE